MEHAGRCIEKSVGNNGRASAHAHRNAPTCTHSYQYTAHAHTHCIRSARTPTHFNVRAGVRAGGRVFGGPLQRRQSWRNPTQHCPYSYPCPCPLPLTLPLFLPLPQTITHGGPLQRRQSGWKCFPSSTRARSSISVLQMWHSAHRYVCPPGAKASQQAEVRPYGGAKASQQAEVGPYGGAKGLAKQSITQM